MIAENPIKLHRRVLIRPEGDVSAHFGWDEFLCKGHCNSMCPEWVPLHNKLFEKMELLRERIGGHPIRINSGFRCASHNRKIKGAPRSRHMEGDALDISCKEVSPSELGAAAKEVGFTGIKVYDSWVHVDLRPGKKWHVGV